MPHLINELLQKANKIVVNPERTQVSLNINLNALDIASFIQSYLENQGDENFEGHLARLHSIYIYFESGGYARFNLDENLPDSLNAINDIMQSNNFHDNYALMGNRMFGSGTSAFWSALQNNNGDAFNHAMMQISFAIDPDEAKDLEELLNLRQNEYNGQYEGFHREQHESLSFSRNISQAVEDSEFARNLAADHIDSRHYQYYINNRRNLEPNFFPPEQERKGRKRPHYKI